MNFSCYRNHIRRTWLNVVVYLYFLLLVILAFREHSIDCFNICSLSQSLHGGDGGFKQNCRNIEQTMGDKKKSRKAESDDPDQYKHGRK